MRLSSLPPPSTVSFRSVCPPPERVREAISLLLHSTMELLQRLAEPTMERADAANDIDPPDDTFLPAPHAPFEAEEQEPVAVCPPLPPSDVAQTGSAADAAAASASSALYEHDEIAPSGASSSSAGEVDPDSVLLPHLAEPPASASDFSTSQSSSSPPLSSQPSRAADHDNDYLPLSQLLHGDGNKDESVEEIQQTQPHLAHDAAVACTPPSPNISFTYTPPSAIASSASTLLSSPPSASSSSSSFSYLAPSSSSSTSSSPAAAGGSAEPPADLLCKICLSVYSRPLSLECGHAFCHHCLSSWTEASDEARRKRSRDAVQLYGLTEAEVEKLKSGDAEFVASLHRRCHVCCGRAGDADPLIACSRCRVTVHQHCYGVEEAGQQSDSAAAESAAAAAALLTSAVILFWFRIVPPTLLLLYLTHRGRP